MERNIDPHVAKCRNRQKNIRSTLLCHVTHRKKKQHEMQKECQGNIHTVMTCFIRQSLYKKNLYVQFPLLVLYKTTFIYTRQNSPFMLYLTI